MNISMKQKQTHREQTCGCQGEGGRIGSLGLADANYYRMDKRQGPTV